MWIKALLEDMDRIIHGGKHYPVVNGVANVPKDVRDDLVSHTHFEDMKEAIEPETEKAVLAANKTAGVLEEAQKVEIPEEEAKEPEKEIQEPEEVKELPEAAEDPKEEEETPKTKKTTKK